MDTNSERLDKTELDEAELGARLADAAALLASSRHTIAFTGAGVSAESGVPTFRGKGGIWERYDERHLEIGYFKREPARAWPTIKALFYEFAAPAEPNDAHKLLAAWESRGRLDLIVTQNIDGLHALAGSVRVAEFHGSTRGLVCLRCGARSEATAELLERLPPQCGCGGVYKPDFVFFGEGIPEEAYRASFEAAERAELCLVIGSTGTVYPAASIPRRVKARGGAVIDINPEPSAYADGTADIWLPMGAAEAMRELDRLLMQAAGPGAGR